MFSLRNSTGHGEEEATISKSFSSRQFVTYPPPHSLCFPRKMEKIEKFSP